MTGTADTIVRKDNPGGRAAANASAWLRENQGVEIWERDIDDLWNIRAPSVAKRAMKVLQEIDRRWPTIGDLFSIGLEPELDTSWLGVSWSENFDEIGYLLFDYLRDGLGALSGYGAVSPTVLSNARITPKGYALLEEQRVANPDSAIGFCAMWFADDLKPLWTEAIEPAIRAAGYDLKRIDQHEHVNRIDEEIIALIRRSRFVVADFTGQRGGVYFEAGFALGLGLRVIWLCREDELEANNVHFDTRQYNFLAWKPNEYDDLAKRLEIRIEANLGRGPIKN